MTQASSRRKESKCHSFPGVISYGADFSDGYFFAASISDGQYSVSGGLCSVRGEGKLWRGTNLLPVTFVERRSLTRTTGGWSPWGMCSALKRAFQRAISLWCPGMQTNPEIRGSTIFAERAAPPRRWNDLCLLEIWFMKDRKSKHTPMMSDRDYITIANFSSSACIRSTEDERTSRRITASRALCRETP